MDHPTCSDCPYWRSNLVDRTQKQSGECRRHAPRLAHPEAATCNDWAPTKNSDWCGDHPRFEDWLLDLRVKEALA
jgi:hypothetical protein